jgi:Uma2 family endonuclease
MSGQIAKTKEATYEDLCALPDHVVGEIVNGELVATPRPKAKHIRAASRLGIKIGGPYDLGEGGAGGWMILDEPELHLSEHVLVPDIAGWRKERMQVLPDSHVFDVPPDWVCEVISPNTAGRDCLEKAPIYAEHGVCHLWLLDPEYKSLEIYRLNGGRWGFLSKHREDEKVRAEPFHDLELDLNLLWT